MVSTGVSRTYPPAGPAKEAKKKPRKRRSKAVSKQAVPSIRTEIYGLVVAVFSLIVLLSLLSFRPEDVNLEARSAVDGVQNWIGPVGAHIGNILLRTFGVGAFVFDGFLFVLGTSVLFGVKLELSRRKTLLSLLAMVSVLVLLHISITEHRILGCPPAGFIGAFIGEGFRILFSTAGTLMVAGTTLLVVVVLLTGVTISRMIRGSLGTCKRSGRAGVSLFQDWRVQNREKRTNRLEEEARESELYLIVPPPVPEELADSLNVVTPVDVSLSGEVTRCGKQSSVDLIAAPPAIPEVVAEANEGTVESEESATQTLDKVVAEKRSEEVLIEPKIIESEAMRKARGGEALTGKQAVFPAIQDDLEFELPPMSFLEYSPPNGESMSRNILKENAAILEEKLLDFGVAGKVVEIHPGPVITMYEFKPAPGVKISKIANLTDDLSMALAALRVRIVAPIPGKNVVGIEVPNQAREIVYLKEILADSSFIEGKSKLTLALGKDIVGYPQVMDLSRMPHLLVAGSTGSGKSVAINSFICSILYKASPKDVRMLMVDPKMLELSPYEGIPHLLLPVVTDPKKAAMSLRWAVSEMERRYKLMAEAGVRNIAGYNGRVEKVLAELEVETAHRSKKQRSIVLDDDDLNDADGTSDFREVEVISEELPEKLPLIVIVIDELADLMMVASKDVETSIARLAQMARAAGIHLIIATQRPSVDVITGLIKANFPARISFQVASKVDSRTILDRQGAESLLGMGDMLFLPPGSSKLSRIHGSYVSEEEVARIIKFLKNQGKPNYCLEILESMEDEEELKEEIDYDVFYDQAVAIVAETRQASISYLQRRLKIGYNRAARIIETMEQEGVVGPQNGSSPREVLIQPV